MPLPSHPKTSWQIRRLSVFLHWSHLITIVSMYPSSCTSIYHVGQLESLPYYRIPQLFWQQHQLLWLIISSKKLSFCKGSKSASISVKCIMDLHPAAFSQLLYFYQNILAGAIYNVILKLIFRPNASSDLWKSVWKALATLIALIQFHQDSLILFKVTSL